MLTITRIIVILMLVIVINAVSLKTITNISRMIPKKKVEEDRTVPLEKKSSPTEDEYGKRGLEAKLALQIQQMGFVRCDTNQQVFFEQFSKKYADMRNGHRITLYKFNQRKFQKLSKEEKIQLCLEYLQDDVLQDTGLRLISYDKQDEIKLVDRRIHFDYEPFEPEDIEVLQCPIIDDKITKMIYFSPTYKTKIDHKKHYFVFTEYSEYDSLKLIILMNTILQRKNVNLKKAIKNENEILKEQNELSQYPIRIRVMQHRFSDAFRLFGKTAEQAYVTKTLGFYNPYYNSQIIHQFIQTVNEVKQGYEILSNDEWFRSLEDNSASNLIFTCFQYIKGSTFLSQYKPNIAEEDDLSMVEIVEKTLNLQSSLIQGEKVKFYRCPVLFQEGIYAGKTTVDILPVHYRPLSNCKAHAFYIIRSHDFPLGFSEVDLSVTFSDSKEIKILPKISGEVANTEIEESNPNETD